ncbi:MAG: hypothetical protein BM562_16635 [Alphaproteobacteria bacterium MedPE-SWcel]|nr:MAG: hypothetical protein BM562_16635 [Alphaproteobacteria bacterium MedPE-SWcel]
MTDDDKQARIQVARDSFSGRGLTDTQFAEAWALSGIIHGEINRSGSFHEKLTDYAHAFARNERFDAMRSEAILRDIYKGRYGETMNQTREALLTQEEQLPQTAQARILVHAESIAPMIQEGPTRPFYQAYDAAAVSLSGEIGIAQTSAKALMKDAFQRKYGRDLYEAGKEVEQAYHKPVRDAGNAPRKVEQLPSRSRN